MNEKIKAALKKAVAEIRGLSDMEFVKQLEIHSNGAIAYALHESYIFANSILENQELINIKISHSIGFEWQDMIFCEQLTLKCIIAANDETYMMAA